jgi:Glycosyl hydrolases family 43
VASPALSDAPRPTTPPTTAPATDAPDGGHEGHGLAGGHDPTLVQGTNFPDPFVLVDAGHTFVYSTNTDLMNIPVLDLSTGERIDALPVLPAWSEAGDPWGQVWAPTVANVEDTYVMWYSTLDANSGLQCISVATAGAPTGPFADSSNAPAICPTEVGGAIDPSLFHDDDGNWWLLHKTDGNCCGIPTEIRTVPLSPDATRVVGDPTTLIDSSTSGRAGIVEAPSMGTVDGDLVLLYSSDDWRTERYATHRSLCESASGPCIPDGPAVLESWEQGSGPGGAEFIAHAPDTALDPGVVVFHAWEQARPGYRYGGPRQLWVIDLSDTH